MYAPQDVKEPKIPGGGYLEARQSMLQGIPQAHGMSIAVKPLRIAHATAPGRDTFGRIMPAVKFAVPKPAKTTTVASQTGGDIGRGRAIPPVRAAGSEPKIAAPKMSSPSFTPPSNPAIPNSKVLGV